MPMMSLPSWVTAHAKWNKPSLGNITLPGAVYFHNFRIGSRFQEGKAAGGDYGDILLQGLKIPDFSFELLLFSGDDETDWERICPLYMPRKYPDQRSAIPVFHPILSRYQISNCIVLELEETQPIAAGPLRVVISCKGVSPVKENAAKNIKATGQGGNGPGGNLKAPSAIDINVNLPSASEHNTPVQPPTPSIP